MALSTRMLGRRHKPKAARPSVIALLRPDVASHVHELATQLGRSVSWVHAELEKLIAKGLVERRGKGLYARRREG